MSHPLWTHFWPRPTRNQKHKRAACKACVTHYESNPPEEWEDRRDRADLTDAEKMERFEAACNIKSANVNGVPKTLAAHINGHAKQGACPHASAAARTLAKAFKEDAAQKKADKRRAAASASDSEKSDSATPIPAQKRSHNVSQGASTSASQGGSAPKKARDARYGAFTVISSKQSAYTRAEVDGIEKQALRAVASSGSAFKFFENEEVKKLMDLIRPGTSAILPSGKVEGRTKKEFKGKEAGAFMDGWKAQNRASVNGVCANVNRKAYPIDLIDATALGKDGPAQRDQFAAIIDQLETDLECIITHFVTDADGGSLKGRKLLQKMRPWLFAISCTAHQFQLTLGDYFKSWDYAQSIAEQATQIIAWINNHSKVRVVFDTAQRQLGRDNALAYLVACITRWTTHFTAFARLFELKKPIVAVAAWQREAVVKAQVGAAVSTEAARLRDDANYHCDLAADPAFWNGLEQVLGDIEVICYATNLAQGDSTRADQVLLSLVGVYLRFSEHPEQEVRIEMLRRLEKRWGEWDQILFLVALILNPWETLSCFGSNANLDHFKVVDMVVQVYRRLALRPGSGATIATEKAIAKAMGDFLAGVGCFSAWHEHVQSGEMYSIDETRDPVFWWQGYLQTLTRELALLALTIFSIVVNQAAVERVFSFVKERTKDRRNRLGLPKAKKLLLIDSQIRADQRRAGVLKERKQRVNHKSITKLLDIPRYGNLLQDLDDEDSTERGRALVRSGDTWRIEMAKWIVDARDAAAEEAETARELAESEEIEDMPEDPPQRDLPDTRPPRRPRKWVPLKLVTLGNSPRKESLRTRMSRRAMQEEEEYMRVMAALDADDDTLDDGEVEISDSEEFHP
ncbi:DUF659 domain-containing protein [Mycena kentingensis (nom. inval.)]|nr:DUF659 domain-containing protein [Mycena kentingensis (nom. inval.)]